MTIYRSAEFNRTRKTLGSLVDQNTGVFGSLGVTLWEWIHPEGVRAEYEAVGRDPGMVPDVGFGDVIGAAAEDTRDVITGAAGEIAEGAEAVAGGAQKMVLGVAVAGAIAALVYFSQKRRRK